MVMGPHGETSSNNLAKEKGAGDIVEHYISRIGTKKL